MKKIEKYSYFVLLVFVLCIPLSQKLSTILLLSGVFLSIIKIFQFRFTYKQIPKSYYLLISLFIFNVIRVLVSDNIQFKEIEQRASLIAIPILFFGFRNEILKFPNKIIKAFVVGCLLSVVLCYLIAFNNSIKIGSDWVILFTPQLNPKYTFFDSVINGGNYFLSSCFSVFHQTVYYATYLIVAILFLLYKPVFNKKITTSIIVLFCITVFLVSNRTSILILILLFIGYIVYFFRKNKHKLVLSLVITLTVSLIVFLTQPRYTTLFHKVENTGLNYESNDRFDYVSRLMVWESSLEVISNNFLFGVAPQNSQIELNKVYKEKKYSHPLSQSLNAHNQYLQIIIEIGILGFILLIILLCHLFKMTKFDNYNLLKASVGFLLVIQMLFEVFLNRYSGIVIFSFLFCLLNSKSILLNDIKTKP